MRFQKAVIINPPNPPGYVSNKDSMGGFGQLYPVGAPPAPALDLPYLAAYLKHHQMPVEVVESGALGQTMDELCAQLAASPDRAGCLLLVRTSLPTIDFDLEVCTALKSKVGAAAVAITGPVVSALLARIQSSAAVDFALINEPDETALELMQGVELSAIRGLVYQDDGGCWVRNQDRDFQRDLDSLPAPAWDMFPHELYTIPRSSTAGSMRFLPMLTSRGCPFGCSYCPYPVGQGLKWRFRSPVNVVDEMENLIAQYGVEYILFRDPMFSMRQDRVVGICDEIVRRGLKIQWRCETRVDCLDEETIEAMARAGCSGINFGVESTDPEIQKGVHRKPITTEDFRTKIALCKKHGIQTFAFFIVGLPGDTVKTILDSIQFATDIEASWTQFTVSTPFIGTSLHQWASERGLIEPDHYKIISSHEGSIGNEHLSPGQVHKLHRFAQFLQKNLINRRGILKNANVATLPYRAARGMADWGCHLAAEGLLRVARWHFMRTIGLSAAAPERR